MTPEKKVAKIQLYYTPAGFPIGVGEGHGPPPIQQFFLKTPIKIDAPPWGTPLRLKNEAPHLKNPPSPPIET